MIKSVEFKENFRSFNKGERFEFKPGVNVLVGDQGAGKSTLIELIRCFADPTKPSESDSSWRARSIQVEQEVQKIISLDGDKQKIIAFDFERESPRDKTCLHFDMLEMQIFAMKSSHGQGNLASLNMIMERISKKKDSVGSILLDEPDSALSPRNCYGLLNILHAIASKWNKQVIVSAHNPILIKGFHPLSIDKKPYWNQVLSLEDKKWMDSETFLMLQLLPKEKNSREKEKR